MDLDRERLAKAILDRTLAAPPEIRESLVAELCGGDGELRRDVEWMLAQEPALGGFLTTAATDDDGWDTDLPLPRPGDLLGRYRLQQRIGEGGTSVVFLAADTADGAAPLVAVKVLKPAASGFARQRFHGEWELLQRLEHPGIARALDYGWTPARLPFLVLEHVDGTPITQFCDQRRLSVDQRIGLFLEVCAAVAYAHHRLVLHRDLKPSNILVTADGKPKLLDLGIGKTLRQLGASAEASVTSPLLTPGYASPEHQRGASLTTGSDVYSLGVVLHRLLAGRLPIHRHGTGDGSQASTPAAMSRALLAAPSAPSAVESDPFVTAAQRGTMLAELAPALAGDLDAIVSRALEHDPDDRYPTVDALAEDLRRHLDGEPVRARSPGLRYRITRLWRRHPVGLGLGSAAILAIAAFAVASGLLARQLARERDAVTRERDRTARVSQVLVEGLHSASPLAPGGRIASVDEVLDHLARRVDRDLADDPQIHAELLETLGRTNNALGRYDQALGQLESALALRRDLRAGDAAVADVLVALGEGLAERGDLERAVAAFEQARALVGAKKGEGARRSLILKELGLAHLAGGDAEKAAAAARAALEQAHAAGMPEATADALDLMGSVLTLQGQPEEAERQLLEALAIRRRLFGERHAAVALSLNNLAYLHLERGRFAEASREYRSALAIRREVFGDRHPHVAHALSNLGALLHRQGLLPEAVEVLREAYALATELAPGQLQEAVARNNLAAALGEAGAYGEAAGLLSDNLALLSVLLGEDHPYVPVTRTNIAWLLLAEDRFTPAAELLDQAHRELLASAGEDSPLVAQVRNNIAWLHHRRGDSARAEGELLAVLELRRRVLGDEHPDVAQTLANLASVRLALGRPAEAESAAGEALAIATRALPAGHWRLAECRSILGAAGLALGRAREGEELLRRCSAAGGGEGWGGFRSALGAGAARRCGARHGGTGRGADSTRRGTCGNLRRRPCSPPGAPATGRPASGRCGASTRSCAGWPLHACASCVPR